MIGEIDFMLGFDFTVSHIPGVTNVLPHELSHMYEMLPGWEESESERDKGR